MKGSSALRRILRFSFNALIRIDKSWLNISKSVLSTFRCSHGYRFVARVDDYWRFLGDVHFEPKTTAFMTSIIQPSDVVVDIGAHIGIHTIHFAKKASKVISLEPEPFNYSLLKLNCSLNGLNNVITLPYAASDFNGYTLLYLAENTGEHTVEFKNLHKTGRLRKTIGRVRVPCARLDTLLEKLGVNHVDVVKIDVEGHERRVLSGMLNILRSNPPRVMVIETEDVTSIIEQLKNIGVYDYKRVIPLDSWSNVQNYALMLGKLR